MNTCCSKNVWFQFTLKEAFKWIPEEKKVLMTVFFVDMLKFPDS